MRTAAHGSCTVCMEHRRLQAHPSLVASQAADDGHVNAKLFGCENVLVNLYIL